MTGELERVITNVPAPDGQDTVIKRYQNTGDIIKDLIYCFKNYNYQASGLKPIFSTGDISKDGYKIWAFIKYNIPYEAEPEKSQTTKSFSRILNDAKEVGHDCKHSALLAGSLAWQLGYTVIFKFVNYDKATNNYGHVYTVIENPLTGKRVTIDPLQPFDYAKRYKKGVNYKAINHNTMKKMGTLSRLTSTGDVEGNELAGMGDVYEIAGMGSVRMITGNDLDRIEGIGKGKAKALVKPLLQVSKSVVKHPVKSLLHPAQTAKTLVTTVAPKAGAKIPTKSSIKKGGGLKKVIKKGGGGLKKAIKTKGGALKAKVKARGGIVKTVALAPIRAAATVLLLANFRNFAGRLNKMLSVNPAKVQEFSKKFGFKYDTLVKQIKNGATKKPKFGSKQNGIAGIGDVITIEGIGVIALATAITTAAPVILALTQLFKGHGLEEPEDLTAVVEAGSNLREAVDQAPDAEQVEEEGGGGGEEAAEEAPEEGGEMEVTNGAKGKKLLEKIEATTKATAAAAKAYQTSANTSKAAAQALHVKASNSKAAADEIEGRSFVEKLSDSVKEHPVWWITGTAVTIYAGSKILKLGK